MAITCNSIATPIVATMPNACATFSKQETFTSLCGAGTSSASCTLNISGGLPPYTTTFSYPQTPYTVVGCTLNSSAYTGGAGTNPSFGFAFTANDLCNMQIVGLLNITYKVTDALGQVLNGNAQYSVNITRTTVSPNTGGGGGGGLISCVSVHSYILNNGVAGSVLVGDEFMLTDPYEGTTDVGNVVYSKAVQQPIIQIVTESGARLTCSHTAPIPTELDDYIDAIDLLGHRIPVANGSSLENGDYSFTWDEVISVIDMGTGWVQHISVDDQNFWASDDGDLYILHHNKSSEENQVIQ